ncbi:MAG: hypothetical protein RBT78_06000 [Kiritimatiellia bacterium]|jgi:uncharacterized membrane protein YbjE (DUF340 family)|nr:hypothetical protein [Kiritimatiellia bacterium]
MPFPVFEAMMLVCFGAAWPISILKSWRSRTNRGKSLFFMLIVFAGYVFGLCHKLFWQEQVDGAVWLYLFNLVMVGIDLTLYYRNHRIDKAQADASLYNIQCVGLTQ